MGITLRRLVQRLGLTASSTLLPLSVFTQNQAQNEWQTPILRAGDMQARSRYYYVPLLSGAQQFLSGLTTQ
ncbi:MAG: hypothetical protein COB20_08375 [SAR86 cluster bacterium]|uniref:Uncharacterized protein n=1 Tax=SAR86 cluster bacterium TaxID=2030880 RepID=A0A2A4X5N3_9GAMM|nr:MAG: hypothetical protein COB20_08375 [SAR86 cluster bacterium]